MTFSDKLRRRFADAHGELNRLAPQFGVRVVEPDHQHARRRRDEGAAVRVAARRRHHQRRRRRAARVELREGLALVRRAKLAL